MGIENDIKICCYDGSINKVDAETRTAVKKALDKVKDSNIFKNLTVHIASDFSNLPEGGTPLNKYLREHQSLFNYTRGITTDDINNREVYIQESAFWTDKLCNIFSICPKFQADKEIEQATMHEFGHVFDYSGGDKKLQAEHQKLIEKYSDKQFDSIQVSPNEEKIIADYTKNNGYSDKKEFKDALEKDLKDLKLSTKVKMKFGYFLCEFYARGVENLSNRDDIEAAESSRLEVFAQLFSYIMGTDDGNKDEFISLFPNTYNVVQKFIKTSQNDSMNQDKVQIIR